MLHSVTQRTAALGIFALLAVVVLPIFSETAEAASLQQGMVRLDRLATGATTGGTVCAKTAVADVAESDVVVTFPTGFTLNETASNWSTTTTNLPPTASAWTTIGATATSAVNATKVVTFSSGNLTADTLYCFNFSGTSTLTNGSAGGSQTGTIVTGGNSSSYALAIVASGADQISVTADVPATFTFALGATTAAIGTLSTTTASATGVTATIGTNAASGWVAWVKSANAALYSASTTASVATAGTVNDAPSDLAGLDGYVLDVNITTDSGTGTGTVSQAAGYGAEYNGTNTTSGGTLSTTFQPIAASNGTTDNDILTLIVRAKISAVQAAASDYADTLTVVAAGRF